MGLVDPLSVVFDPPRAQPLTSHRGRACPLEKDVAGDWYDLDSYQSLSIERLHVPGSFGGRLEHGEKSGVGGFVIISSLSNDSVQWSGCGLEP